MFLEQLEKQKAAAEVAEDDDELIIEGWETSDADGAPPPMGKGKPRSRGSSCLGCEDAA